jgi:hypothetical protein
MYFPVRHCKPGENTGQNYCSECQLILFQGRRQGQNWFLSTTVDPPKVKVTATNKLTGDSCSEAEIVVVEDAV